MIKSAPFLTLVVDQIIHTLIKKLISAHHKGPIESIITDILTICLGAQIESPRNMHGMTLKTKCITKILQIAQKK